MEVKFGGHALPLPLSDGVWRTAVGVLGMDVPDIDAGRWALRSSMWGVEEESACATGKLNWDVWCITPLVGTWL